MKHHSFWNTFATAAVLFSGNLALAEEKGEMATIRLSQGILRHDMMSEKSTVGSTTTKSEESGFTTMPTGFEIAAYFKEYAVYVSPLAKGTSVTVSRAVGSDMEAGVSAAINSQNIKDGNEIGANSIGGYFFYTRPLTPTIKFETDVSLALLMGNEKTKSNAAVPVITKQTTSGYSLYLDLLGVIPLAKNFEYAFGIDYSNIKSDIKSKTSNVSSTRKSTESDFGIILAKFRYFI